MGYQSKTWSLSDEVVAAVEKAKDERGESPNQFFLRLIRQSSPPVLGEHVPYAGIASAGSSSNEGAKLDATPPARELLVELDGEGE